MSITHSRPMVVHLGRGGGIDYIDYTCQDDKRGVSVAVKLKTGSLTEAARQSLRRTFEQALSAVSVLAGLEGVRLNTSFNAQSLGHPSLQKSFYMAQGANIYRFQSDMTGENSVEVTMRRGFVSPEDHNEMMDVLGLLLTEVLQKAAPMQRQVRDAPADAGLRSTAME